MIRASGLIVATKVGGDFVIGFFVEGQSGKVAK